jgi:hypothetical protein
LIARTEDEVRSSEASPFKLKPSERLRLVVALRKNDLIELEGERGTRSIYRVQQLSSAELQLSLHHQTGVDGKDRNVWNRITSIDSLRQRGLRFVNISPTGELVYSL